MRILHAYENEDGTFRVDICDKVEYFVGNIKQWKDGLIQIPRAKISLDILNSNNEENTLYTISLTDFEKGKEERREKHEHKSTNNRSSKRSK